MAKWISKNFIPLNANAGGLSLEDWAARTSLLISMYIPQIVMAIYERQGPFETISRNIMMFFGGIGIALFVKNPTLGFNAMFNKFMMPKEKLAALPKGLMGQAGHFLKNPKQIWKYTLNHLRPKVNYLEIFQEAGLNLKGMGYKGGTTPGELAKGVFKNTLWTGLDVSEKQTLLNYTARLKTVKSLLQRISVCKILSVISAGILATVVTGIGAQMIVFRVFAPLDRKFTPRSETRKTPQPEAMRPRPAFQGQFLPASGGGYR